MDNSAPLERIIPHWIERVTTDFGGRDPLGLSRVSNIITDYLLTGIITTTDRARYYSFYCWALWHITREESPKKYQDFVGAFRKREATVALATIANDPNTSPVGVLAARPRLQAGSAEGKLFCNFRVLPANQLGGYGQYYAGSLYQLGLTFRTDDGINRAAEGNANDLANLFHSCIKDTSYIKSRLYTEDYLPFKDFQNFKKYLTIDALHESFCNAERQKLVDIFFGLTKSKLDERDILRRHSLAQILFIVSEYQKNGSHPEEQSLDMHLVYAPCYYDSLGPINNTSIPYVSPQKLAFCKSLWRQFCLQQYFTQAIEGLMYCVLEIASTESSGIEIDMLIGRLLQPAFYNTLKDIIGKPCDKPSNLLLSFGISNIPTDSESLKTQKEISHYDSRSEAHLLTLDLRTPQATLARWMVLLAILYSKWRGIKDDPGLIYVSNHAESELWARPVLEYMDKWLNNEVTWADTLKFMADAYILKQHDKIMYEKGRLDSCWLHRIEGRIFKDQDYGPRWRSTRHDNATSILHDLGLLNLVKEGPISITPDGEKILELSLKQEV